MTAMGVPGGGRNEISPRVSRHFSILGFAQITEDSISYMFKSIIDGFYTHNSVSEEVKQMTYMITKCTVKAYSKITEKFLPVPKKAH